MFTGLVEEVGTVSRITPGRHSATLRIAASIVTEGLKPGDSLAVNGACLTVVAHDAKGFSAQAVHETLDRTTLGTLVPGSRVNLERALAMGARLGGHIVTGHVDEASIVERISPDGEARIVRISPSPETMRLVVRKGSVAIDGVSLTVTRADAHAFEVSIIPHTVAATTLHERRAGDRVNLEVDVLGRYVEKLVRMHTSGTPLPEKPTAPRHDQATQAAGIGTAMLALNGFI